MAYRAVLFDIGGVVVGSPLEAIAAYERTHGVPAGFINRVVVGAGPGGAWSRLERGELRVPDFYDAFEADCTAAGCAISARTLMTMVGESTVPRPAMLEAIRRIREAGLRAAAVTNNWIAEDGEGTGVLRSHFDVFIESAVVGVRKPDPGIYRMALQELDIAPAEGVFLDDIGANLKTARELGLTTIKVADPERGLDELASVLGFPLR